MPIADYAHHNEEAPLIWWQEEGRHDAEPSEDSYWEHEMREDAPFEDEECQSEEDCMKWGNYNQEDEIENLWSCSTCGRFFKKVSDEPYVMEFIR